MPKYPYIDCFNTPFRVERVGNHHFHVYEQRQDEFGPQDVLADEIDDCETERGAAESWQQRQADNQKAEYCTVDTLDHYLGNPLFAIETNLEPLAKRIKEKRIDEALEIVTAMKSCVERMKEVLAKVNRT